MFTRMYNYLFEKWVAMEVWQFHASQEYLDYVADVEWIKKNRDNDDSTRDN